MSTTPIWFLDIDGVVNALSDDIPRATDAPRQTRWAADGASSTPPR